VSYVILTWKSPSPRDYGRDVLMLSGRGEHEGTNVTIFPADLDGILWTAQEVASSRYDYKAPVRSLIVGESKTSPQEVSALALDLDRRFLQAHADRLHRDAMRPAIEAIAELARAFA
jgi:hypothetical protein